MARTEMPTSIAGFEDLVLQQKTLIVERDDRGIRESASD
jgi:hypothetical protein